VVTTETEKGRRAICYGIGRRGSDRSERRLPRRVDIAEVLHADTRQRPPVLVDGLLGRGPPADRRRPFGRPSAPGGSTVERTPEHGDAPRTVDHALESEPATDFSHVSLRMTAASPLRAPSSRSVLTTQVLAATLPDMSNSDFRDTGFATRAVHIGQKPDPETGAT